MPEETIVYPALPSHLRDIRERVEQMAGRLLSAAECEDLKLAVTEACANAVLHSGSPELRVTISVTSACVEVVVEDDGVYRSVPARVDGPNVHRGLLLMAAMTDDFSLHRGTHGEVGTTVRLRKCAS